MDFPREKKEFPRKKMEFLSHSTFIAIYRRKKRNCNYSLPIAKQQNSERSGVDQKKNSPHWLYFP